MTERPTPMPTARRRGRRKSGRASRTVASSALAERSSDSFCAAVSASRVCWTMVLTGRSPRSLSRERAAASSSSLSSVAGWTTAALAMASQPGAASARRPAAASTVARQPTRTLAAFCEGWAAFQASATSGSFSFSAALRLARPASDGFLGALGSGAPASPSASTWAVLAEALKTSISVWSFSAATTQAWAGLTRSAESSARCRACGSGTRAPSSPSPGGSPPARCTAPSTAKRSASSGPLRAACIRSRRSPHGFGWACMKSSTSDAHWGVNGGECGPRWMVQSSAQPLAWHLS